MNFIRFIIAGVSIFLSACSGIVTTNVTNEIDTDNINKALITSSEESKYIPCQFLKAYSGLPFSGAIKTDTIGNTDKVIQEELKKFVPQRHLAILSFYVFLINDHADPHAMASMKKQLRLCLK